MSDQLRIILRPAILAVACGLYGFLLKWAYVSVILEPFSYQGFRYAEPTPGVELLTWFFAFGVAILLPQRLTRPSGIVLWILYVVTVAPTIFMSPYLDILDEWSAVGVALIISLIFAGTTLAVRRRAATQGFGLRVSPTSFWLVLGLFSAFVYVYIAATAGLSFRFLSLLDVYDVRDEYDQVLEGAGLLGYLVSTQANVINPLIIARGIYSKRWSLVAVGAVGQLLIYSGTGFKTVLFSLVVICLAAIMFRVNLRPRASTLLWGASAGLVAAAVVDRLQGSILWSSLFGRRFLFTPARLTDLYVEFFSANPKEMLSHSVLAPWFDSPYEFPPARTIALWSTGSPNASLNANLFADGFAQFGWFGAVGVAVVLVIYLRLLDRAAHGLPAAVTTLVVIMPAITLSNTSILTAMFSHGLVVALLALAIAPRGGWGTSSNSRLRKTSIASRRVEIHRRP